MRELTDTARIRVLLVEDNPGDARLVTLTLAEATGTHFDVVHIPRLNDALQRLNTEHFDLMLLDLTLPDRHGLDTVKQAHEAAPFLPVVVMTGLDDEELALKAVQMGAQDYLVKGLVDTRVLVRTIRHAVERHRMLIELRQARQRENYLATHDTLTGLPNRELFYDRLSQALTYAERYRQWLAVVFLDVDRFKTINDTLGHALGDQLLKAIARRLQDCIRKSDTAARIGGDEFTVILNDVFEIQDSAKAAQKLLEVISQPYQVDGRELFVSASAGIALYPGDGKESKILMKNADTAMYNAKDQGRGTYQFYAAGMNARALERLALENNLRKALEKEQFLLCFQPLVDVTTSQYLGMEALVRWQHPDLGLVSPADFIPLAEDTGLIIPIGEWVIRNACAQTKRWHDQGHEHLRVSVNLSMRQFRQRDLAKVIGRTLQRTGLNPRALELEITESCVMEDPESTVQTMTALKQLGVSISIDDFGTGQSSLAYLKRFPADVLKIDRSFVRDITQDPDDAAITTAIIAMAKSMKLATIAEGVETRAQLEFLLARGCHQMQGFLFSRPVPAEEFEQQLVAGARWQATSSRP